MIKGYTDYIFKNFQRVLTQIDRDEDSKTYGSCDRNYWHLKIRDFSSAILQQTCLTLALVYKTNFKGNIYYLNDNIKEWSIACLKYMCKIQLKDGSFNEYYPNEHGFPPTAFNLYAALRTYIELELDDDEILDMIRKACNWLIKHDEVNAYNQEIASIAGLYLYYTISKDNTVLQEVNKKIDLILDKQSDEGWFPEQGGADIGYSSVAFDMLMEYYFYSRDERVLESINKLLIFLSHFVHPDGTIGGEYGSRNTIYFMPNGLETYVSMDLEYSDIAKGMIQKIYMENHSTKFGDFMDAVDERYLTHYVMHSYLRAIQKFKDREEIEVKLPYNTIHYHEFKDAGLITSYNGEYFAIISTQKGGLVKVYKKNELYWDCGYRIPIETGLTATTNWLNPNLNIEYYNDSCEVSGNFSLVKPKVQSPIYHLGLRVLAFFIGKNVNKLIKKLTIYQNKTYDATFKRKIELKEHSILIVDNVYNPNEFEVKEASNISLRLVASGKFFSRSDILRKNLLKIGKYKNIAIMKEFFIDDEELKVTIERGEV